MEVTNIVGPIDLGYCGISLWREVEESRMLTLRAKLDCSPVNM